MAEKMSDLSFEKILIKSNNLREFLADLVKNGAINYLNYDSSEIKIVISLDSLYAEINILEKDND
jgi:hypothetical protein